MNRWKLVFDGEGITLLIAEDVNLLWRILPADNSVILGDNPARHCYVLTLYTPTLQNGQTHSNNSSVVADEMFECVWPFCEIGT